MAGDFCNNNNTKKAWTKVICPKQPCPGNLRANSENFPALCAFSNLETLPFFSTSGLLPWCQGHVFFFFFFFFFLNSCPWNSWSFGSAEFHKKVPAFLCKDFDIVTNKYLDNHSATRSRRPAKEVEIGKPGIDLLETCRRGVSLGGNGFFLGDADEFFFF